MAEQGVSDMYGMMAEYEDVKGVYNAAQSVRDAGYKNWDVYCPFPIHNMNEAMGMKDSRVAWVVGCCAAAGLTTAIILQGWTSGGGTFSGDFLGPFSSYPMITGGKPFLAWEQFMPIFFELSVLFSAFGAILGMLAINKLPMWYHPLAKKDAFLRASDDRFFIAIETKDPNYDEAKTRELLQSTGAKNVEMVEA